MASVPNLPHFDLKPSFGALYIGILTSIGLLGITTLQTWLYYQRFPKDPILLRFIVAGVWILELLHSVCGAHALYHYVILNWGNPLALEQSIWSLDITLPLTAFVETTVRAFFMWRIWIVSGNNWIFPSIIATFGLGAFACTIGTYILSVIKKNFADFGHITHVVSTTGLAFSIAADLTVTCTLCYYLNHRRTGFSKTNQLLNRLIFFAVNIGLLTSMTDIAVLVCSSALMGESLAYLAVYEIVSKFYANSLLATLNIRDPDVKSQQESHDLQLDSFKIQNSTNRFASGTLVTNASKSRGGQSVGATESVDLPESKMAVYDPHATFEMPSGAI